MTGFSSQGDRRPRGTRCYLAVFAFGILGAIACTRAGAQQCCPGEQCPGDLGCDDKVDIAELITMVNAALDGCPAVASPTTTPAAPTATPGTPQQSFPATGQTTCWDGVGNALPCSGTGQDGEVRAGGALAYVDNGDGTVTDPNTELMWEKKSADGSIHDRDNSYDWAGAASTFIAALNTNGGFAGYTDWRLPNVKELESIISHEEIEPVLTAAFHRGCMPGCTVTTCSCVQSSFQMEASPQYWSSTSESASPDMAWTANTLSGVIDATGKAQRAYVRAVRGQVAPAGAGTRFPATGQTTCWNTAGSAIPCSGTGQDGDGRAGGGLAYVDNGDGTITDLTTQLVWEKKSADGTIHDWETQYNWVGAFTFIAALNAGTGFAAHTDWRLPNVKELQSIVDYEYSDPVVHPAFNSNCMPGCAVLNCSCTRFPQSGGAPDYWSSTSDISGPLLAWRVDFTSGEVLTDGKEDRHFVRAVRGGL